jgi:hypothetical protein
LKLVTYGYLFIIEILFFRYKYYTKELALVSHLTKGKIE